MPAALASARNFRHAVDVDRIVVAHQHDRRRVVVLAERADHGERLDHGLAGVERAQAAGLDRRAVRHRIGERHAELDHVGAGLGQRLQDFQRGLGVGIAGHREGDERGAAFAFQVREALVDAGGHLRERALGSIERQGALAARLHLGHADVDGAEHDQHEHADADEPFLAGDLGPDLEQARLEEPEQIADAENEQRPAGPPLPGHAVPPGVKPHHSLPPSAWRRCRGPCRRGRRD